MSSQIPLTQGKICSHCHKEKPLEAFNKSNRLINGHRRECRECQKAYYQANKECWREYARTYRATNPEAIRKAQYKYRQMHLEELRVKNREYARHARQENNEKVYQNGRRHALRYKYGLTSDQYLELLQKQSGVCAICGRVEKKKKCLGVDHNHTNGKIRGLLCSKCNVVLGQIEDDITILERMIVYLENKEELE